jgi:elongation factor Ts
VSTPTISAKDVKALRDLTGAGMMDCKKALQENGGDVDASVTWLREKGIAGAAKLGGREATEGTVQSYIHANGKVGVLVEVDCNTDFVAKNEDFTGFARDIALHIAATPSTRWVTEEDVPDDVRAEELRIAASQMTNVPEHARERAASGKVSKWLEEVVLLKQVHVNGDKYEGKTIEELRTELSART